MATRAHLREQITSDKIGALTPVALASVAVYETGTTTPVAATMYQTATGVGTFTNPLTADANGVVEFWMTNAQVVDLAITAAGYNTATVTAQVIGTDTATGIVNLNTTTTPTAPGDVRINGENFTYEGAASLHTVSTLDQAQTITGAKVFTALQEFPGGVSPDGTHTLTLPAATDTLVGKATADTLTNKTLTTPVITGSGGTLTLPAGPDTLVGRATTDTLTNKTITAGKYDTLGDTAGNAVITLTAGGGGQIGTPTGGDKGAGTFSAASGLYDNGNRVAMVRIANTTLGVAATNITFSSIPGTFAHLRLVLQSRGDGAVAVEGISVQLNGDVTANYDSVFLQTLGSAVSGAGASAGTSINAGAQPGASASRANTAGATVIDVPNYAATTFEKQVVGHSLLSDSSATNDLVTVRGGSWRNTAAITSIKLFPQTSANFVAGTRASLYGVN